ncbi:MAG: DUF5367 domain-containing protein [Eudoraea sp.]|nr:DUF5367 domain-containing protein [Eudoraea sp.]MBT8293843.1 DUF5367 domain-containing protein [Eudoraea sp.]
MEIKRAIISAAIVWTIGVTAYILSYFVKFMDNPELQANIVLTLALIPSVIFGAKYYYKKGAETHGFKLGVFMFLVTICFDALITVPLFIIPAGGSHLTFFSDAWFWFIGLEYILLVGIYAAFRIKILGERAS